MSKITYVDKVALNTNTEIPAQNKVEDTDMNNIKGAINEIGKYNTATAGTNGDFNVTLKGTLSSGDIVRISFPTATVSTANARLSIDGGVTYKNIAPNGFSLKSAQIENNKFLLIYDGTQWTFLKGTYVPIYDQKITNLQNGYGTSGGFKGEESVMTYLNARNQFSGLRIEFNINANARELAVVESMFYNTSGFLDLTIGRFNGPGTEISLNAVRLDVSNTVGITISQCDEIAFPSLTKLENTTNIQIVRMFGIV